MSASAWKSVLPDRVIGHSRGTAYRRGTL